MRKRALMVAGAGLAAMGSNLLAGSSAAQAVVDTFSNLAWRTIDHGICLNRAEQSVGAAIQAFGIADADIGANTFRVLGQTDDLNIFVYCVADDDTLALDGAAAKRVLVAIYVSTSRGLVGGEIRDFVVECMETGACPEPGPVIPRPADAKP